MISILHPLVRISVVPMTTVRAGLNAIAVFLLHISGLRECQPVLSV